MISDEIVALGQAAFEKGKIIPCEKWVSSFADAPILFKFKKKVIQN